MDGEGAMSERCFIIQPFDRGQFDKRYEGVIKPAVNAAGLEAYRVDRDPSASIPIEQIEDGIKQAAICLADITLDNPNVWFELGYSIAVAKDLCLICSRERTSHYPFDVQHRSIIAYGMEAPSDFKELEESITKRLLAILQQQKTRAQIPVVTRERQASSELQEFEIACLATIGNQVSGLEHSVSNGRVGQEMEKLGYNNLAANVALRNLVTRAFIETSWIEDQDGYKLETYLITSQGWGWINDNVSSLNLKAPPKKRTSIRWDTKLDEEIPF